MKRKLLFTPALTLLLLATAFGGAACDGEQKGASGAAPSGTTGAGTARASAARLRIAMSFRPTLMATARSELGSAEN